MSDKFEEWLRDSKYSVRQGDVIYEALQTVWNARGKVDAEIADQDYGCEYVAKSIREEDV